MDTLREDLIDSLSAITRVNSIYRPNNEKRESFNDRITEFVDISICQSFARTINKERQIIGEQGEALCSQINPPQISPN